MVLPLPPRESSPLLYPQQADSSEGPSTADGHLLRFRERKGEISQRTGTKQHSKMNYHDVHCSAQTLKANKEQRVLRLAPDDSNAAW